MILTLLFGDNLSEFLLFKKYAIIIEDIWLFIHLFIFISLFIVCLSIVYVCKKLWDYVPDGPHLMIDI